MLHRSQYSDVYTTRGKTKGGVGGGTSYVMWFQFTLSFSYFVPIY